MSDLIYYYAWIGTGLSIILSLLRLLPVKWFSKLHEMLPTTADLLRILMDKIHSLIIFAGIYVYIIYNDGSIYIVM